MKLLLRLTARLPGFFLQIHIWLESALKEAARLITRRDDSDEDPWIGIL